jgi:exopolyphosphatase / guanosine-5'-triphosphate,3'-diphosphate pyrophosphatase
MIKRVAGIDIGTNTVLMLIADYQNKQIKKVRENFAVARLGESLDKTGIISDEALERTAEILKENREICKELKVEKIIAVGTSALRDASNSAHALKVLKDALGAEINVISGIQEATYSFLGTVNCNSTALVIDIGGGSTELIIGKEDKILDKISLQIGAVRLTERYFQSLHPPDYYRIEQAEAELLNMLTESKMPPHFDKVYAVAGTATTLATTALGLADDEVEKADRYILSRTDLTRIFDLYMNSTVDDIIHKFRVHPRRADLILAGSLIMKSVVEHFKINEIVISSKGLRYGILADFFKKH